MTLRGCLAWLLLSVGAPSGAIAFVPPSGGIATAGPRDGDSAVPAPAWRVLDDFADPSRWTATASDQVGATLRPTAGPDGKRALCLDYDFAGVSGYAVMRRELPTTHPAFFEYAFQVRGDARLNNFEIKLPDASGDNVWWVNRPNWPIPRDWTDVRLKERHFSFAWGPRADRTLRDTRYFELTISAGREGGAGQVCLADLRFRERAAPPAEPPQARAVAGSPGEFDFGAMREFGGLRVHWPAGEAPRSYRVEAADDGGAWRLLRTFDGSDGGVDALALPESEARRLRIRGDADALPDAVEAMPLAWAATPNDFVSNVAADAPRGLWPRGFSGEQPYWTIVGIDGGSDSGLIGEDGAIELYRGGPSIEPFVQPEGGGWVGWAGVEATPSLHDGDLPIPTVRWTHADFRLETTAFAYGTTTDAQLHGLYRLTNTGPHRRRFTLALALRPLQVNAPKQFLATPGGVSPIRALAYSDDGVEIDGERRLRAIDLPDAAVALAFDEGGIATLLEQAAATAEHVAYETPCRSGSGPCNDRQAAFAAMRRRDVVEHDPSGLATGAWIYSIELSPGESRDVGWMSPLAGVLPPPPPPPAPYGIPMRTFALAEARERVAAEWRGKLDRVRFVVPDAGRPVIDTLRTALAHMLVSRTGPRLQPGTRSYARAWIRDGAMIDEGLLRLGHGDVAAAFVDWYAPYQFADGKVPCCVDDRGADPVPENDSHGQFIHAIAEVHRYDGDDARLRRLWPRVVATVDYMDRLRASERTPAVRAATPAHYGLMPASISHEGYSAKPMHSYWDDFWALRGYKDAVYIAQRLGEDAAARGFAAARDQFAADLYASIAVATRQHGIDFIPGAAELGDFDATSTTIALAPGGERARLPEPLLTNTFEGYWREFVARRDGGKDWDFYTPYELRTVGTFVRLGWRERAHELLAFFLADREPAAWNQWAEVVARERREPFFLGDLPHAWVASDYVRSALDLFAYEDGETLVLAAGIPNAWLVGDGVAVAGLRTPWGELAYELRADADTLRLHVAAGTEPPGGRIFAWPFAGNPGPTTVNGRPANWRDGRLRLPPGDVSLEARIGTFTVIRE